MFVYTRTSPSKRDYLAETRKIRNGLEQQLKQQRDQLNYLHKRKEKLRAKKEDSSSDRTLKLEADIKNCREEKNRLEDKIRGCFKKEERIQKQRIESAAQRTAHKIEELKVGIETMRLYGESLVNEADDTHKKTKKEDQLTREKGENLVTLAKKLAGVVEDHAEQLKSAQPNFLEFKNAFKKELGDGTIMNLLAKHRGKRIGSILANIAIALTGIGAIAVSIKYAATGSLFFMDRKTTSQKRVEALNPLIRKLEPKK